MFTQLLLLLPHAYTTIVAYYAHVYTSIVKFNHRTFHRVNNFNRLIRFNRLFFTEVRDSIFKFYKKTMEAYPSPELGKDDS